MTKFLKGGNSGYPSSFFIPAAIKFLFLVIVSCYLIIQFSAKRILTVFFQKLSSTVEGIITVIWHYRLLIVGLLLIYFAMWLLDQGQDLLLNINTKRRGPVLLYISITTLAFFELAFTKIPYVLPAR